MKKRKLSKEQLAIVLYDWLCRCLTPDRIKSMAEKLDIKDYNKLFEESLFVYIDPPEMLLMPGNGIIQQFIGRTLPGKVFLGNERIRTPPAGNRQQRENQNTVRPPSHDGTSFNPSRKYTFWYSLFPLTFTL